MTRAQILSDLFTSKDFTQCISKMEPVSLQDELKAEVALILCEMDEDKLIGLAERDELKYYTVRIIINQIQSKSSPFYKKFRKLGISYSTVYKLQSTSHETFDLSRIDARFAKEEHDELYCTKDTVTDKIQAALSEQMPEEYDDKPDRAIAEIDKLYWYDREIMKLYAEHGTYRKIEEVTGIPFESVYKTVRRCCKEIKMKVAI